SPDITPSLRRTSPDIAPSLHRTSPDIAPSLRRTSPDITPSLRRTSPDIAPSLRRTSALGTAARMYFAATSSAVRSSTVRGSAKFANRNSSRLHCMG
ncbi:MAG: hypothetical protein IJ066_04860, partial [Bacteroidaceae bacterium]|nr:hypothetical protein [Bacteroidaceae bacterium]